MTTALTNLYVRNIPMEWTAQELISLGEKYGPIVSAKIMYNPLTTASRGMGFIRYAEHADATLAIAGLNGHIPEVAGGAHHLKPLNVQFAKDQQSAASLSLLLVTYDSWPHCIQTNRHDRAASRQAAAAAAAAAAVQAQQRQLVPSTPLPSSPRL
jgi:hypothetical protein